MHKRGLIILWLVGAVSERDYRLGTRGPFLPFPLSHQAEMEPEGSGSQVAKSLKQKIKAEWSCHFRPLQA